MDKSMFRYGAYAAAAVIILLGGEAGRCAVLRLKGGGKVKGSIERQEGDNIYVKVSVGVVGFSLDRVESIEEEDAELREVYDATLSALPADDTAGRIRLALFCEVGGMDEEAKQLYMKVLELKPESTEARRRLDEMVTSRKAADEAEQKRQADARNGVDRGIGFSESGQYGEAITAFEQALELMPELGEEIVPRLGPVYVSEGDRLLEGGDTEAALLLYRKALLVGAGGEHLDEKWQKLTMEHAIKLAAAGEGHKALST